MKHTPALLALLSVGLLSGLSLEAQAQPNPFDAYEGKPQTPQKAVVAPDVIPDEVEGTDLLLTMDYPTKGRITLGASGQLSLTTSSNETKGGDVSNTTTFGRLVPQLGYFVQDRVEVGVGAGLMLRRFARNTDDTATSTDGVVEAFGRYYIPMGNSSLWFVPEANLGMYFGSSTRDLLDATTGRVIDEETSNLGVVMALKANIAYVFDQHWSARAGLALNGAWGAETVESADESFFGSSYHLGLSLGVGYHF